MLGKNMLSMTGLSLYRNAVQFGMNIAITAFIPPDQYGLVVFTTPFLVLIALLTDLGLTSAITRAPAISRREAGAAFTGTVVLGIVFALLLVAVSRPIERRLHMAGLAPVMMGMALSLVLSIAASTPRALLERQLAYGRIAAIEAIAVLLAAVAGLAGAWHGAGAMALVIYNIVNHALRATAFTWLSRRGIAPNARWRGLGGLLSFGSWVLASNILTFLQRNSDNLLIGAALGASAVGIYGLAYQFMLAPVMAITWPTSAILLATLRGSDLRGEAARRSVEAVIAATSMLSVPAMLFLTFGLAWPVHAMLSNRWAAVPGLVAWLAPLGALQSIASYNGAVLMVAGRARTQFLYTLANTVLLVATFVAALPYGLAVFVRAYVVVSTVLSLVYLSVIVAYTGTTWRSLAAALAPAVGGSLIALAATRLLFGFDAPGWPHWIAMAGCYGAIVLGCYALAARRVRASLAVLTARAPAA